jgi:hypothetical protein
VVPAAGSEIDSLLPYVLPELDYYGELIAAIDQPAAGLLVRGEGSDFTRRANNLMDLWQMSAEARELHLTLAEAFEHKRCFLKLEWHALGDKTERQIAVYYRRRPLIHDALKILAGFAGSCLPVQDLRELGSLLGKDTVHFVSFTARPNNPLWYKFYFSQYLTPQFYESVETRLERAVRRFSAQPAAQARWRAYHDRLAPRHREQTVFVSLAVSEDGADPSIKIDYPDVSPVIAAGMLDGAHSMRAGERLRRLCRQAGRQSLSYLGVRLGSQDYPVLKGYADFV